MSFGDALYKVIIQGNSWLTISGVTVAVIAFTHNVAASVVNLIQWTSVVGDVAITDLTRVINNTAARTMQPLLTIAVGLIIYLALAYIVHGLFVLSDMKKGGRLCPKE